MSRDIKRDCKCPYCGKYFNWLGISRHKAMHRDRTRRDKGRIQEGEKRQ